LRLEFTDIFNLKFALRRNFVANVTPGILTKTVNVAHKEASHLTDLPGIFVMYID